MWAESNCLEDWLYQLPLIGADHSALTWFYMVWLLPTSPISSSFPFFHTHYFENLYLFV